MYNRILREERSFAGEAIKGLEPGLKFRCSLGKYIYSLNKYLFSDHVPGPVLEISVQK